MKQWVLGVLMVLASGSVLAQSAPTITVSDDAQAPQAGQAAGTPAPTTPVQNPPTGATAKKVGLIAGAAIVIAAVAGGGGGGGSSSSP